MFERFKKSRGTDAGASSVAMRDREARADAPTDGTTARDAEMDTTNERVDNARFERVSPGERDRGVVAGGGEADLAADRAFERDQMARGATGDGDGDTALDRERARADLDRGDMDRGDTDRGDMDRGDMDRGDMDRGDMDRGDRDHHVGPGAAAAGGAAAAAAATHHHDGERERDAGPDAAFDRDRNREIAAGRMGGGGAAPHAPA